MPTKVSPRNRHERSGTGISGHLSSQGGGISTSTSRLIPKQRLDSWKEIAAFFERDERTVRRWEIDRGLPVHRVPGSTRGVVYAFTDELEEWLRQKQSQPAEKRDSEPKQSVLSLVPSPVISPDSPARENNSFHRWPWGIAIALALSVLAGIYPYRHTARFRARAASTETPTHHIPNREAQDFYLKGRYYWSKRTPDDLRQAVDYFTQAIVKDPAYAQAFMGLADCYNLLREFSVMPPGEAYPRALAAAQRAVELDDSSPEAHNSLAFATFYWNWDAATAEREFKRALELNPNFVQGHHWYATFLAANRRFPEALDQIEVARQLDPSSTTILADKGFMLYLAGRKEDGISLLRQLEATDSSLSSTHAYLARMYFEERDYHDSFVESKRAAELRKDAGALAVAEAGERGFAALGIQGMYRAMLPVQEKLFAQGNGSAFELAATCVALGKNAEALRYLKIALDKREVEVMFVTHHAEFDPLHTDPVYQQLVTKLIERLGRTASL